MKKHILLVLKTLVINSACVEASRTREKKYNIIAVIFALVGLFLSVLPIAITNFNKQGCSWMVSSNVCYSLDKGLYGFEEELYNNQNKYTFEINKDEKGVNSLIVSDQAAWNNDHGGNGVYTYYTNTNVAAVQVYVNTTDNTTEFNNAVKEILNVNERKCTLVVFGKHCVYGYLYKTDTKGVINSFYGDYLSTKPGTKFLDYRVAYNPIDTFSKWQGFFNESFIVTRNANTWKQIGIMCGVNGGVLIFMGAMVFILTRGKNNPFRIYSFWDGQKIAYYASFTPALLSLLGFAIPTFSTFMYPLMIGIRTMWLSMRTLRYTAPSK